VTWVVLGASGFVGSALTASLRARGETVRTLPAPRTTSAYDGVDALVGQARQHPDVAALASELRGARVVVLAAGSATPDARWDAVLVGANALLPAIVALACHRAGVPRMIHLSSAAVQGRARALDETARTRPFSPYSRSKARGEEVLHVLRALGPTEIVVVRATSVQGKGRPTTAGLQRVARSRLASVAGVGTAPSPVSSAVGLADFVHDVGRWPEPVPSVLLQPWAGLSTAEVLRLAGGREPQHLPAVLCRALVGLGYLSSRLLRGRLDGPVRRAETLWFGQAVKDDWARQHGLRRPTDLGEVLGGSA
jgi:dTDP-4-dehydrorhamnose reductase